MILVYLAWASALPFLLMILLSVVWLLLRYKSKKILDRVEYVAHVLASIGLIAAFGWGYLFLRMWYGL